MNRRQSSRRHACLDDNDKECQRCSRLGRPCVFPSTLPINPGRKSRIDELQDQINELRNQLAQRGTFMSGDEPVPQTLRQYNSSIEHTMSITPRLDLGEPGDLLTIGILTLAQCNRLLGKFRTVKMPQFPFVIIPDSVNAISIRREYSFLFMTIMTVSTEERPALQKNLDHEVQRTISTRIIMNNERNIDLLLGLLVYTAWYHYHWESMLPHMYMFLQLSVTMVADLGLDREPNFTMRNIAASLGRPASAHQLSAYVFELKVKPVLILGQIVYHRNDTFLLDEMDQLDDLISSAESFIASFLEIVPGIAIHLPLSFYTYLWYALLVLSKVLLLSDLGWERTTGLGRRIHGVALAAIEQHGELSRGNDVWANTKRVIGSMISWLEKHQDLRGTEQRVRKCPISTMPHSTVCDEVRPACNGCLRHSVVCDYQLEEANSNANSQPVIKASKVAAKRHTFISSYQSNFKPPKRAHRTRKSLVTQLLQISSSERILPALPCRPFEFSIVDMELFHNFVSPTDYGASDYQSATRIYHSQLTRLGFSFPYVLRLLLASSGFQLARRPEIMQQQQSAIQGNNYHVVAERHYNIAIREVAVAVPRLNKENCHAIYTAAVHIFIGSLAMGPRPGEYMAFRDDGQPGFLSLFIGVRTVLEISSKLFSPDVVLKGDEGELSSESESNAETTGFVRSSTIASEYGYWMGQLRHLIESEFGTQDPQGPAGIGHIFIFRSLVE
ncbi:hypothetical protein BDV32DRAFT_158089 [Aspergillus pseudonomiae]|uniref:Uncharacterized protein n=1 Tax=Aspergillus pseudonomiae TaxID=1506151 RepID=A0A5N6IHD2_9EURO|nr:uncharacterized protein BDV37DRAFT_292958 [Aspergillus pseudonomiae]KAB8265736.1 hypothetical protein BDV32DRAFT_158089 [Aspergillus pseudonomiae]KAE8405783.1 hypothetical protein BDV37DRAFT_292958 [Aspergillus pseudonomiae]